MASAGKRNNLTSSNTKYFHEISTEAVAAWSHHHSDNNLPAFQLEVPCFYLSYTHCAVSRGHTLDVP